MESITDYINEKAEAMQNEERKTKAQARAERWKRKQQEYLAYRETKEFKEGVMNELVIQYSITRNFPNDPDYKANADFNYIYLVNDDLAIVGKEQRFKETK